MTIFFRQLPSLVSGADCSEISGIWTDSSPKSRTSTGPWLLGNRGVVLSGAAKLEVEDRTVHLGPGDSIHIPAHTPHRVLWTTAEEPTVWLAVFYGRG